MPSVDPPGKTDPAPAETIRDKTGAFERLAGAKLDLGCGPRKRAPDYVGVDVLDYPGVDVVGDAFAVLRRIPTGTLSEIYSSHFLEHIDDVEGVLLEFARVLAPGGKLTIIVPHFSNPYFFSDVTHRQFFGLYSFAYFSASSPFKRSVPTYNRDLVFTLESASLRFKSARPFYGRYVLKRGLQWFFNLTRGLKEFYEENLTYIFPCYEIAFVLTRNADAARVRGPQD